MNKIKEITVIGNNRNISFNIESEEISNIESTYDEIYGGILYDIYDERGKLKFNIQNCSVIIEYVIES